MLNKLCCDKCDGNHRTTLCPYYRKKRGNHPDEQKAKKMSINKSCGKVIAKNAYVIRQPGDGNCLFHSLSYGLGRITNAYKLRRQIAEYIIKNPNLKISGSPLKDWIKWDTGLTIGQYYSQISSGKWGGGIEMAICSKIHNISIHVYEKHNRFMFKRISCFDSNENSKIVNIVYQGGIHYDALKLRK